MNIKVRYFEAPPSTYEGEIEFTETCVIIRCVDEKTYKRVKVIIPLSAIWQVVIDDEGTI